MSDAIRIEQRLHDLERRLQEMFAGLREGGHDAYRESPREMEEQAIKRLFEDPRSAQPPGYRYDAEAAREMERQAIKRLYGGRSTVVVEPERRPGART